MLGSRLGTFISRKKAGAVKAPVRIHLILDHCGSEAPMPVNSTTPAVLTQLQARRIWLRAQRLDTPEPFGGGTNATLAAIEHLGYVQIDTINVIERCHHHILWTRIPAYKRRHLRQAQTVEQTVFEYRSEERLVWKTGDSTCRSRV